MIAALLLSAAALAADASPHFSYPSLVTANGYGAVVYGGDRLESGWPHLYQQYSASSAPTPDLLYDAYWGWVGGGAGAWWNEGATGRYEADGGIIAVDRPANPNGIALHEYAFAPMGAPGFALAHVVQVENTGATESAAFQLVSLHNWHVGGTETVSSRTADSVSESGSDIALAYTAPDAGGHTCSGLYDSVLSGVAVGGDCNTSGGDVVPGFAWQVPALPPGGTAWFGVYTSSVGGDGWVAGRAPEAWVTDEIAWWDAFHDVPTPELNAVEAPVYRQQLAFLKMAQVREEGDAYGQIPASLPLAAPVGGDAHIWNITWVRDGTFAAVGLLLGGYPDEAADALRFLIQPGKTGAYRAYVGDVDYAVSVCRTYGDGSEWSDSDANGPNVEFDDFGLFLWALGQFHAAGRDDLLLELGPRALDGVADVLVGLVDPTTELLDPDSSIWERHWNGHQEQFTWSSAWAVEGLRAAAVIADVIGDPRADTYTETADRIATAIRLRLRDAGGVVPASLEQLDRGSDYLDLAAVEVFNRGIVDASDPSFAASMDAWSDRLAVASGHGFMRNDDGDTYDSHEWIFVDLRVVDALRLAGETEDALFLEEWVTNQAVANANTLPELYEPTTGDYAGPAPMLGFGAGAYVITLATRTTDDPVAVDDTGADKPVEIVGDCACGSTSTPPSPLLGLVALALLRRARRSR